MNQLISQRLGIVAAALGSDVRQIPRAARVAGFRGILFDVWSAQINLPALSATGRREFVRMLSAEDQRLIGLRMDLGPKGLAPGADLDRQIDRANLAMQTAAELGAALVCVDLGPLPLATAAARPNPVIPPGKAGLIIIPEMNAPTAPLPAQLPPDTAFISQVNTAMAEIGARADRYSVVVAFSSSLAGFASLSEALASARCPWFGTDLDPVAILRDEWSRDEIFSSIGPLVRHVCARDALAGADKRTKPAAIGQGDTNWAELLCALDQAGYSGFLTVDPLELPDRPAAAAAGVAHLRSAVE